VIKIRNFKEEFYDGIKRWNDYHEIFVNPTKKELDIVYHEVGGHQSIRFLAKNDTKKLYVFNGSLLHIHVIQKLFNANWRIMVDPQYQMLGGSIENNHYEVTDSDTLYKGNIKEYSINPYMYLKFLLKTDWSWIDNYIIFSPWWEIKMIPNLKKQLEEFEKELENND